MKDENHKPDPSRLLEAFLTSNRSERAFTELVKELSSLVYSSAKRRTGSAQLAEEVAQNVFAILARKAESLRRHPALTAWLLETTRLQSASVIRSEKRRQRKAAALSDEFRSKCPVSTYHADREASWKDALPVLDEALDRLPANDRQLILQRFFEGKKFREIASKNGQSEAACKMRVKRALEKMSTLLKARGVTLSASVLGSILTAELVRSAPAATVAVLTPKALVASSSLSSAILITNTLHTMSTAKSSTITAAAVIAIAAIPISQQQSEARKMQSQLSQIDSISERKGANSGRPRRPARSQDARDAGGRTASSLLISLNKPMGTRALLRDLCSWSYLTRETARQRVARMTDGEHSKLMEELGSFPCGPDTHRRLSEFLLERPSGGSPDKMLDQLIATGQYQASMALRGPDKSPLTRWAKKYPAAAVKWYEEKLAGDALMAGLGDDLFKDFYLHLMPGVIESDPELALDLYARTPNNLRDFRGGMYWPTIQLAEVYGKELAECGNGAGIRRLLDLAEPPAQQLIVSSTAQAYARAGKLDEGLAFVDQNMPERWDPKAYPSRGYDTSAYSKREDYVNTMASTASSEVGLGERLDWLLVDVARPKDTAQTVMKVFSNLGEERAEAMRWLARQESGQMRDAAHAQLVWEMARNADYDVAMEATANIDDLSIRSQMEKIINDSRQLNEETKG